MTIPVVIEKNFGAHVHEVMSQGMNTELLLMASGYPLAAFNAKLRDDGFTPEEKNRIYSAIGKWKFGNKGC